VGDNDLHTRLVAGDLDALGDAYDAHSPVVYGLALKITGDPAEAAEITQDVFVDLWERPFAFDPDRGSLSGWLASLTLHRAVTRVDAM
jgi:RNA polymerase sigma-70 factor (ECF subfamily)